jgi:hypothetical protein
MVDARHQLRGTGRAAMQLVIAHVRGKCMFDRLFISNVPAAGSPESLYNSLCFDPPARTTMARWCWRRL